MEQTSVLILLVVLAVAGVFVWRRMMASRQVLHAAAEGRASPYRCIAVRQGQNACDVVKRLGNVRYLSSEAPPLPVPGCNLQECRCTYVHYSDRRHQDRREAYGQRARMAAAAVDDRRDREDRRASSAGSVTLLR